MRYWSDDMGKYSKLLKNVLDKYFYSQNNSVDDHKDLMSALLCHLMIECLSINMNEKEMQGMFELFISQYKIGLEKREKGWQQA